MHVLAPRHHVMGVVDAVDGWVRAEPESGGCCTVSLALMYLYARRSEGRECYGLCATDGECAMEC